MVALSRTVHRLLAAGGLAVAVVAAPLLGAATTSAPQPAVPAAQCAPGEEPDVFTGSCVPYGVPASKSPFTGIQGNPNVPAVKTPGTGEIPCPIPYDCIGLGQSQVTGPQAPATSPDSTVGGSPTVTGRVG